MKTLKLLGLIMAIVLLPLLSYAGVAEVWSTTQSQDRFSVACSSVTATQVLDTNTQRVAWTVSNPNSTYCMYISTFAITSTQLTDGNAWHKIDPAVNGTNYSEEVNPYLGSIYIIVPSGTTTISGEERVR
jgi:putative hemolysin